MKNSFLFIIFASFMALHTSSIAQIPNISEQTIREAIQKKFLRVKKILKCAAGQGCSEDEMHEARILLSNIFAGIIVLTGGAVFAAKKLIPAWQKRKMHQKTQEVIQTSVFENLTPEQLSVLNAASQGNTNDAKKQLEEGITISPFLVEAIGLSLQGNKVRIKKLYEVIQNLANAFKDGTGEQKLNFETELVDQTLWEFFKNASVIPSNRKQQKQFYRWAGGMEQRPTRAIAPRSTNA